MAGRFPCPSPQPMALAKAALLTAILSGAAGATDGLGNHWVLMAAATSAAGTESANGATRNAGSEATGGNDSSDNAGNSGATRGSGAYSVLGGDADNSSDASGSNSDSGAEIAGGFDSGNPTMAEGESDLYLTVTLNATAKGLARFEVRNDALWASAATLTQLGFILSPGTPDPVRVDTLSGADVRYDRANQTVAINMPVGQLSLPQSEVNPLSPRVPQVMYSPGVLLNYDLYGTLGQRGTKSLSGFTELRAFGSWGLLSNTAVTRFSDGASGSDTQSVRLDTVFSRSFPGRMLTMNVGDTLTGALGWSRSTRIGGIQFESNFSLQPYRITTPVPALFGSAAVPSDVELYVNGIKQYTGETPAGPFQLNTLPNINGQGNAQVVLRDALGHVTTLDFSFYAAHQLLAPGLTSWSGELGFVRKNYGLDSFSYGSDPAASGTWRHGFNDHFTAEAHAEATKGLANFGGGASVLIGEDLGVVHAAAAHSVNRGVNGSLAELGYDWSDRWFNISVEARRAQRGFRDVATLYGSPEPLVSGHATLGFLTPGFGNFNFGYLHLRMPGQPASRYASTNWFMAANRSISLSAGFNQNLDNARDRTVSFNLTYSAPHNVTVSTAVQRVRGVNTFGVDANKPAPFEGGFGWRVDARGGDQTSGQAELDYLGAHGRVDVGVMGQDSASTSGYAEASGALVFMGGGMFASRHIDDAFTVVSTSGIPGVPVLSENRLIGTTNSKGLLLVTPVQAYQDNHVSIDPVNLPPDVRLDRVSAVTVPSDRAGTLVNFDINKIHAASITLYDGHGTPLALGSNVRVRGQQGGEPAVIGFDGVVYLENLDAHNVLDVDTKTGHCVAEFDYHAQQDEVPVIGPLVCRKEQP